MNYSHSKINTYKMCPKMFEYKYIKKLTPLADKSNNLFLGELLHKGVELKSIDKLLEYIDTSNYTPTEESETLITMVLAMVEAYFLKFGIKEKIHNELYFTLPIDDDMFEGYIDGLIEEEDGYYLLEIKTASIVDKTYIDKLRFNDQIERYLYGISHGEIENFKLDKPILGIKYRIIKKPLIRQKQKESIMEFRNRLIEKLQEEDNIQEIILSRTEEEINEAFEDIKYDINIINYSNRYTKTLSACSTYGRCPYMELCSKEENAELLYIIKEERRNKNVTKE